MIEERFDDERLEIRPRHTRCRRDGNEVAAEEDAFNEAAVEQGAREWRRFCGLGVREIARAHFHHHLLRQELAGCRVGCLFGADQHDRDVAIKVISIKH